MTTARSASGPTAPLGLVCRGGADQAGPGRPWTDRDRLAAELAGLRSLVRGDGEDGGSESAADTTTSFRPTAPSCLDRLAAACGLTEFERAVLVLAAGPELVAATADELMAHTGAPRLSFGAALAVLPGAHWSALTPLAPLRRWNLVRLLDPTSPTASPLVVDERVLHEIVGAGEPDAAVAGLARPVSPVGDLPATLAAAALEVVTAWRSGTVALLTGPQPGTAWAVVGLAGTSVGRPLLRLSGADLLATGADRAELLRRLDRETLLGGYGWAVDVDGLGGAEARVLLDQLSRLVGPVVVVGQVEAGELAGTPVRLPRLTASERTAALAGALEQAGAGSAADAADPADPADPTDPAEIARVAGVFDLDWDALPRVAAEVAGGEPLWSACRRAGRTAYGRLAQVRTTVATWDDLVLPALPRRQLGALCAAVRQRHRVLGDWGFADRGDRGLGTTALFSGPSGTGKTLAAEVIAGDLGLDLVHVDLSQVVSKYIGESEKHLAALFDAAEGGGAVLLFDEADALFGKRSEVRDSHDRYANLEVGYLLQRMEAFRGLAVLTTNARSVLDPAFLRRVHTVVAFPYPDAELRAALWRRAFPAEAPTDGVDPDRLAAIDLPGGGIAAAALTAAYLAAEEGSPITTRHVTEAARWELAKSGRTLAALPERRSGHA